MIKKDEFTLTKMSINYKKDIYRIHYEYPISYIDDEYHYRKEQPESDIRPHNDLMSQFDCLSPMVIESLSLPKDSRIKVKEIKLVGSEDTEGIKIKAHYGTKNNQETTLDVPVIYFVATEKGTGQKAEEIFKNIESECYEYLFNQKKENTELPFDD